jgi:hypothetical protein
MRLEAELALHCRKVNRIKLDRNIYCEALVSGRRSQDNLERSFTRRIIYCLRPADWQFVVNVPARPDERSQKRHTQDRRDKVVSKTLRFHLSGREDLAAETQRRETMNDER